MQVRAVAAFSFKQKGPGHGAGAFLKVAGIVQACAAGVKPSQPLIGVTFR